MSEKIKNPDRTWTIIEIVKWTAAYFEKMGLDSARLKSELLLCHVLDITRIEIYSNYNKPLTTHELSALKSLIKRSVKHEPIQMLIGKVPFHNLELCVDRSTIVPRPETEQLVELIINSESISDNQKILDIGTGSGCIAISIAKGLQNSVVKAIDISSETLELASMNAKKNNVSNVTFSKIDVSKDRIDGKFDIVVSNPPYINIHEYQQLEAEVRMYEPKNALTDGGDGLSFYKKYAEIFPEILAAGGKFYLEIGWGQSDEIFKIFSDDKFEIEILNDINNIPRFVKGRLIKS